MEWWEKKLAMIGGVTFRGQLPPRQHEFASLAEHGISLRPDPGSTDSAWLTWLSHPDWGVARLSCSQAHEPPPSELYTYSMLSPAEMDLAQSGGSIVSLSMDPLHGNVLRDRKLLLRFMRAVMGNDGLVAIDVFAQKVWSREALDDELAHDADLDIEGIMTVGAVAHEDGRLYWMHSHGLAEIGGFDFDILNPWPGSGDAYEELFRSLAYLIMEGTLGPSTGRCAVMHPNGVVRTVEMERFLKDAAPQWRDLLSGSMGDDPHMQRRSVLCEPTGSPIGGAVGGKKPEPVKFLTRELPEEPIFWFSKSATELMAERAKNTYTLLRSIHLELAELDLPCLLKLGIDTDAGAPTDKEHLWFEAHKLGPHSVDATLVNQPYHVSRMKEGSRGRHSIDLISDWSIMTPMGQITPRSTLPLRMIRADWDEARRPSRESREG